jgi:hypothetical protein
MSLATPPVVSFHRETADPCVARLREAYGVSSGLFDRQLRDKRWEGTLGTEDLTSTGICLVGLHRARIDTAAVGLDVNRSLAAMARRLREHQYPGGLGLLIWANAVWNGGGFSDLLGNAGVLPESLETLSGFTTMETAWLVSGLLHETKRSSDSFAGVCLDRALSELRARFRKDTGLFSHASADAPFSHRLRRWVANFADQIYSVQALAFSAIERKNTEDRGAATACADRLVALQGGLGQWWWHYDPRDGQVAQPFPVYSVHQHAMAPMALMALERAGGGDYLAPVERSHAWITKNELDVSLLDTTAGTIWRDIELAESPIVRITRQARNVIGRKQGSVSVRPEQLKINWETRPYEWAWCLYAGAIAEGVTTSEHIA